MQILVKPPRARRLSDALSWSVMADPRIIVTKQAELMCVLRYRPRDLASSSPEQLLSARQARNKAILRFGSRWAFWFEACRYETNAYDEAAWPDPVSRLIDEQQRKRFTRPGAQFETDHFITMLYAPQPLAIGGLAAAFAGEQDEIGVEFERFRRGVAEFGRWVDAEGVAGDDLLSYLDSTVCTRRRRRRMQPMPLYLSEFLATQEYLGGRRPMLADHHVRCVRIVDLAAETDPRVFSALDSLPFPFRRVARWMPLSREHGQMELEARKKAWADRVTPLFRKIIAYYTRDDDGERDSSDAVRRVAMSDEALKAHGTGDFSFGYWTHTVVLTHPDAGVCEERCREVQHILEADGFAAEIAREDATSVWIGTLPGHPHGDLGRFLGSSLTFSEVLPATAPWRGPERDFHLDGPALLRGLSDGGTAFRFSLHQEGSDVGHMLVVGQTGSGKSVLISTMIAAHRKYPGSRIVVLDRGASAKCITLALGGEFHALAADDGAVSLQPLAFIDQPAELAWAYEWVLGCLEQEGLVCDPAQKEAVYRALESLAGMPAKDRTITVLRGLVQDDDVKLSLAPFCLGGPMGDLLDNDHHRMGSGGDVSCFETAALMERPNAVGPVMAVVFREVERRFDGRPTMLVIDEAWAALDHPLIAGRLRSWLKTARKANVAVIMATQSLADVASSSIRTILSESCPTRVFGANDRALERGVREVYAEFGLTPEQTRIIAELRPKADYVFTAPGRWRKLELGLSALELAFVGSSRPHQVKAMDAVLAAGPREEFHSRWLAWLTSNAWEVAA